MNKKTLIFAGAGILAALLIILTFWLSGDTALPSAPSSQKIERAKESVKLVLRFRRISDGGIGLDSYRWSGSAFVVNDEGCLVTNAHIVSNEDEKGNALPPSPLDILYVVYEKQLRNRKVIVLQKATVEHMDVSRDLAWIRVTPDRTNLRPLELAKDASAGQGIVAMGFPGLYDTENRKSQLILEALLDQAILKDRKWMSDRIELEWTSAWGDLLNVVTVGGSVSEIRRGGNLHTGKGKDATCRIITHTAPIHGGMSGGPLLNTLGQVVGVTYGGSSALVLDSNGNIAKDSSGNPLRTNAPLLNSAVEVTELRHFLTSQAPNGEKLILPGDPDSFLRRLRAHLSVARPYEVALAALGVVFTIGAVITLLFLMTGNRRSGRSRRNTSLPPVNLPPDPVQDNEPTMPMNDVVENEGKTIPFPTAGESREKELSVVLSGTDPDGNPLRFRFTEKELRELRTLLIGSRRRSCHICLPFNYISRQQARLLYEQDASGNGLLFLQVENATNTTCINGAPVRTKCPLEPGDKITMGPVSLTLTIE